MSKNDGSSLHCSVLEFVLTASFQNTYLNVLHFVRRICVFKALLAYIGSTSSKVGLHSHNMQPKRQCVGVFHCWILQWQLKKEVKSQEQRKPPFKLEVVPGNWKFDLHSKNSAQIPGSSLQGRETQSVWKSKSEPAPKCPHVKNWILTLLLQLQTLQDEAPQYHLWYVTVGSTIFTGCDRDRPSELCRGG